MCVYEFFANKDGSFEILILSKIDCLKYISNTETIGKNKLYELKQS